MNTVSTVNIAVVGYGYPALTNAARYTQLGFRVSFIGIKNTNYLPLDAEPDLDEMFGRAIESGRLSLTSSYAEALRWAQFVIVAGVFQEDVQMVVRSISDAMDRQIIIVNKCIVPFSAGDWVAEIIRKRHPKAPRFSVVHCSEFLRRGHFVDDFMSQRKTFVRSSNQEAALEVAKTLCVNSANVVVRVV